jgi:hypothetical protein
MMKVQDFSGNDTGFVKNNTGFLVLADKSKMKSYMVEKERLERLNRLEKDVEEIKSLLVRLIEGSSLDK